MNILRPHDLYVLLALRSDPELGEWTYEQLAQTLGLSASQVFRCLHRAASSHLFDLQAREVRVLELLEFLTHGVRYAFATTPQRIQRGMATGWHAPGLEMLMSIGAEERLVWAAPDGTSRGLSIEPLHPAVLAAAGENERLYQLLALTDILRVGTARERRVAAEELARRLR